MERGEVHFVELLLPDWSRGGEPLVATRKLVVTLRGGVGLEESYVPVVVASTDKRTLGEPLQPFEVSLDQLHGFKSPTVVDCRWVFSLARHRFSAATFRFILSEWAMEEISVGLAVGLQL